MMEPLKLDKGDHVWFGLGNVGSKSTMNCVPSVHVKLELGVRNSIFSELEQILADNLILDVSEYEHS